VAEILRVKRKATQRWPFMLHRDSIRQFVVVSLISSPLAASLSAFSISVTCDRHSKPFWSRTTTWLTYRRSKLHNRIFLPQRRIVYWRPPFRSISAARYMNVAPGNRAESFQRFASRDPFSLPLSPYARNFTLDAAKGVNVGLFQLCENFREFKFRQITIFHFFLPLLVALTVVCRALLQCRHLPVEASVRLPF